MKEEPLEDAIVTLVMPHESGGSVEKSARTGPDGQFRFERLKAGEYRLRVDKTGYRSPDDDEIVVSLAEGEEADDLVVKLMPAGVVEGVVRLPNGQPAPFSEVRAFRVLTDGALTTMHVEAETRSDANGAFRMSGLAAGSYVFAAEAMAQGEGEGRTILQGYYPGVPSAAEAAMLRVPWGAELPGVRIELVDEPRFGLSGVAFQAGTGLPCASCEIRVARLAQTPAEVLPGSYKTSGEGKFHLALPRGAYTILARQREPEEMSGSVEVMVSGEDLTEVRLPVSPGAPVRGAVVLERAPEGVEAPESSVVFLPVRSPLGETRNARVAREGLAFAVDDLLSGTYRVRLRPLPAGGYLKSVRIHGVELPGSELTITGDTPLSGLELVVAFDGGTVRGKVRRRSSSASGNPRVVGPGAIVGLLPLEYQRGCQLARYATVDDEGGYEFTDVAPGDYRLVAFPESMAGEIADPQVYAETVVRGRSVRVLASQELEVDLEMVVGLGGGI